MNLLSDCFQRLKREKRKAFIAYITAGFPSKAGADRAFRELERGGVDVIEIGVPFSDPIADGPTIQYSSQKALEGGVTLSGILNWTTQLRKKGSKTPIVLMSYLNPIHQMGYNAFARRASVAGINGLIVPDTIPEETEVLGKALRAHNIDLIFLVAPTTPPARRRWIAQKTRGFLYAISLTGVTGARKSIPPGSLAFLTALRRESPSPVAVGFGISGPDQVRRLAPAADGIIVGSALINRLREGKPLYPFVKSLRKALED